MYKISPILYSTHVEWSRTVLQGWFQCQWRIAYSPLNEKNQNETRVPSRDGTIETCKLLLQETKRHDDMERERFYERRYPSSRTRQPWPMSPWVVHDETCLAQLAYGTKRRMVSWVVWLPWLPWLLERERKRKRNSILIWRNNNAATINVIRQFDQFISFLPFLLLSSRRATGWRSLQWTSFQRCF